MYDRSRSTRDIVQVSCQSSKHRALPPRQCNGVMLRTWCASRPRIVGSLSINSGPTSHAVLARTPDDRPRSLEASGPDVVLALVSKAVAATQPMGPSIGIKDNRPEGACNPSGSCWDGLNAVGTDAAERSLAASALCPPHIERLRPFSPQRRSGERVKKLVLVGDLAEMFAP